jgi:alkylation response protein AidB-like acyl-CoA dehydrogenase|tara:strand:- start:2006 stop:3163 length:1158 start_codon:yes stop_codon:yes gene_type:complete
MSNETFREEVRDWLRDNYPAPEGPDLNEEDAQLWLNRLIDKRWTAPGWPTAYGGGGLENDQHRILLQEMAEIGAGIPAGGMGMGLIGPTLLEFGTEEQKQRHLTRIVRREVRWCQGYSEPGAGSDLAGLSTRAEDNGDYFLINGQKTWTSGANLADWIFALVRTNPEVPKHDGISFVLMDMHQPGITVRPIRLISGASPFCDTFFDDAIAQKEDLVGKLNQGWTVGKRLLQHERSGGLRVTAGGGGRSRRPTADPMGELAKKYVGEERGKISDPAMRDMVLKHRMNQRSLQLTQARAREENKSGRVPAETTSIFKLVGSTLTRENADLQTRLMGSQGYGWQGDQFSEQERTATRSWLRSRAVTIYGGTNEVQMNIISKRVLGLPD